MPLIPGVKRQPEYGRQEEIEEPEEKSGADGDVDGHAPSFKRERERGFDGPHPVEKRHHPSRDEGHHVGNENGRAVSYTHLRAHETDSYLVCRLLLEKK